MKDIGEIREENRFRIVRRIAGGGMGDVYEALQLGAEGFQKRMAVKMLSEALAGDREFVEMFIGEAKLVADLVHENIAQVYQLGRHGGTFYIAMEYIHGVNLQELLDRHGSRRTLIPVELGCFIVSRVCRALEYAHGKRSAAGERLGVVHRDVSLKNIMISFEGVVKLTDFGIAKARHLMAGREGEILLGKIPYMSPEQAAFEETDSRSDLFSLGICFHEILSGALLYRDDDSIASKSWIAKGDIPPIRSRRADVSYRVEEILRKSLQPERNQRYQRARDMLHDLEHYLYDEGFGPTNNTLRDHVSALFPERIRL
jgi:serine/threonine-protein kinase